MKAQVNEITIRYSGSLKANLLPRITSSESAAHLAYSQWNKDTIELHETFKIMLLNNANRVKGIYEASSGGITGTPGGCPYPLRRSVKESDHRSHPVALCKAYGYVKQQGQITVRVDIRDKSLYII